MPNFISAAVEMPWVKLAIGIGTVFVGLIAIVLICSLVGLFFRGKKAEEKTSQNEAKPTATAPIQNRGEVIAAVSAAIAEELGTDVDAIRIHSFKQI